MEEYYVAFKEKRSIYAEAQFEVDFFKNAFPDMYDQIGMRDWGPFTILVKAIASQAQGPHRYITMPTIGLGTGTRGTYNSREVPIEVVILFACIMDHVHINVEELIEDKFKRRAKQHATSCHFPASTIRADSVITLVTKTNKDAPTMKRAKCTSRKTPPPPSVSSTTSTAQFYPATLAKAIPYMIQTAIKKVVQPAKDKLKSLCSTVEVLESE
ncbi:hypothetical protein HAX54_018203, partial [Datura stramonium]|nr:hypothetical protein [Datura stramonium]